MIRAKLDIFMKNGQALSVQFVGDEEANVCIERLKKAISDPNACFNIDMVDSTQTPPASLIHYIPSREIVRFCIVTFPRSEAFAR